MSKLICVVTCVLLALAPMVAQAAAVSPENFDGYADTNDWDPIPANEGWAINPTAGTNTVSIGSAYGLTDKGMASSSANASAEAMWYYTIDTGSSPLQTTSFDVYLGAPIAGDQRLLFSPRAGYDDNIYLCLRNRDGVGQAFLCGGSGYATNTYLPGQTVLALYTWVHVDVECDWTNHLMRARIGVVGDAMQDWSDWAAMTVNTAYDRSRFFMGEGEVRMDNVALRGHPVGAMSPDDFERYQPTTDWDPTQPDEGWVVNPNSTTNPVYIGTDYGLTGQGMASSTANAKAETLWYDTLDTTLYNLQTTSFDFYLGAPIDGDQRVLFSQDTAAYGAAAYLILRVRNGVGQAFLELDSGYGTTIYLPGQTILESGTWFHCDVETDWRDGNLRARIGEVGATMQNWSDWGDLTYTAEYEYTRFVLGEGEARVDNVSVVGNRSTEPGKEWVRSHPFMVSSLVAHEPWNTTLYEACNLNSVHVWFSDVDLCEAVAAEGLPWHFTIQATSVTQAMIDTVNTLSDPSGDDGWYLFDEPASNLLSGIASAAEWLKRGRPNSLIYLNLAGYDSSYVDDVIETIEPDALMYDYYIFSTYQGSPVTYDSYSDYLFDVLMGYRSKTLQNNIPLFIWKQTYSAPVATFYAREPSESEMRMDVYSGLAAGCKGISYFLWDAFQTGDSGLSTSLINSGDTPSSMYYAAQAISPEVSNLGKALRYLNNSDVRYVPGVHGSWPYTTNRTPSSISNWSSGAGSNSHITNVVVDSGQVGNGKDGMIGFFNDDTGRQYFMLSNQYCGPTLSASQASLSFTVTFDSNVNQISRLSRSTGEQETISLNNHVLNLTLPGGTGDLFCMDANGFDLSAPSGSVTITENGLSLSATDDKGVMAMRFSNDELLWSGWEPYATTKVWTFESSPAVIYAQFKDDVGNISPVVSDSE